MSLGSEWTEYDLPHDLPRPKHLHWARFQDQRFVPHRAYETSTPKTPRSPSHVSIHSFPVEVLTNIISPIVQASLDCARINSFTRSFIPIRHILSEHHNAVAYVCQSWRNLYLDHLLPSSRNRGGSYVGMSVNDLVQFRQWYPKLGIRGCLLFLGDPNRLLIGTLESNSKLAPFYADPTLATLVEAIEWDGPGIKRSCAELSPPELDRAMLDALEECIEDTMQAKTPQDFPGTPKEQARAFHERNARFLASEAVSLVTILTRKIFDAHELFPQLKSTEIPTWAFMVALGIVQYSAQAPGGSHRTSELLGEPLISQTKLQQQLKALVSRLERLMLVGYPSAIFDTSQRKSDKAHWDKYLGDEAGLRLEHAFSQINWNIGSPCVDFKGLKGLGWRSDCFHSSITLGSTRLIYDILTSTKMAVPLEELYVVTSGRNVTHAPKAPILTLPIMSSSKNTLTKLILHLSYEDYGGGSNGPHNCTVISRFDQFLPNIEYLDISVDCLCRRIFKGSPRPQKRNGTFIFTLHHDGLEACCPHSDSGSEDSESSDDEEDWIDESSLARDAVKILDDSAVHFKEMHDWKIQIRLETAFVIRDGNLEMMPVESDLTTVCCVENTLLLYPVTRTFELYDVKLVPIPVDQGNEEDGPCSRWEETTYGTGTTRAELKKWAKQTKEENDHREIDWHWTSKSWEHWLLYPGWGLVPSTLYGSDASDESDD